VFTAAKISEEIHIRGVRIGQDCISPSSHSRFSTTISMMQSIGAMRRLSGGKPTGFPWEPVLDAITKDFEDAGETRSYLPGHQTMMRRPIRRSDVRETDRPFLAESLSALESDRKRIERIMRAAHTRTRASPPRRSH
jgi:hypothetical protein